MSGFRPLALQPYLDSLNSRYGLAYRVPPSLNISGTGILTCCPSTTPFGLALGTD